MPSLQGLEQQPGEVIFQYFAPNIQAFKKLMAGQPNLMMHQAVKEDTEQREFWEHSEAAFSLFLQTRLFISGHREPHHKEIIRHKCTASKRLVRPPWSWKLPGRSSKKPVDM